MDFRKIRRLNFPGIVFISWNVLLLIAGCEKELPTAQDSTQFIMESVEVTRNTDTNALKLTARALPAEGFQIDSLIYEAFRPDSLTPYTTGRMYDDATHGDVIPFNHWYSIEIPPEFINPYIPPDGNERFVLLVTAFESSGDTLTKQATFVLEKNYPVHIQGTQSPDTVNAYNLTPVFIEATVIDSNGISDIRQVQIRQYKRDGEIDLSGFFPMDNTGDQNPPLGIPSGDRIAGDNIWSITFGTDSSNTEGSRTMQIVAQDMAGTTDTSTVQFYIEKI